MLAMALAIAGLWMRSYGIYEGMYLYDPQVSHSICSEHGRLVWQCDRSSSTNKQSLDGIKFDWMSLWAPDPSLIDEKRLDPLHGYDPEWHWKWGYFSFGAGTLNADRVGKPLTLGMSIDDQEERLKADGPRRLHLVFDRRTAWVVPFWSLILPLTLLSTYLLLVKPKKLDRAVQSPPQRP